MSEIEDAQGDLSAQWLRSRFALGLPGSAVEELPPAAELIPAAVLVPVVQRVPDLTVLFTQRTSHLHDHPGQVAFPGGRRDAADATPIDTALREAEEEIGLARDQVDVLGVLPEYRTSTGFRVTPVVGLVSPPLDLRLDSFEVAEVFETPLAFLLDPANHQRMSMEFAGALRQFWAMPFQGYYIWGATAGMVVSLYRFLFGLDR
jgi:8-oxo-dGTP pyrophosphatase MutT (NUDIX family)